MDKGSARFARCDEEGCRGAQLQGVHCLEHVTPDEFDAAVARLQDAGEVLDARDTTISAERLDALLDALKDDAGRTLLPSARFDGATFSGVARFDKSTFSGVTSFDEATFRGDARFEVATFTNYYTSFRKATFSRRAGFDLVTFSG